MSDEKKKTIARFKVVVLGDGGVGKTTLTQRYLTGVFDAATKMTIGFDFYVKKLEIEGKRIGLQLWDFAGERQFRFLLRDVILGTDAALFLYDMTRFTSFKNLNEWLELYTEANKEKDQLVPAILVGAKLDLAKEKRAVTREDGQNMMKKWELIDFIECSSKTGDNVEDVFIKISRMLMFLNDLIEEY